MLKLNVPFCAYACLYYERNRPVFKFKIMKVVGLDLSSSRHSDKPRDRLQSREIPIAGECLVQYTQLRTERNLIRIGKSRPIHKQQQRISNGKNF